MPVFKKVKKDFFKKWTAEMAYVLGFFAADGYITSPRQGGRFWSIQITDEELLHSIQQAVGSEHKISCRRGVGNEKDLFRLQIGSVEMVGDLNSLGFRERKTNNLAVPHVPQKYLPDFVRGYFDGDGNVWTGLLHTSRKTRCLGIMTMFTSCSHLFLKQLYEKLCLVGLRGGSLYRSKRNYSRLQFSTLDSLKLYDFMYNHGVSMSKGLFLERKKNAFDKFKKARNAAIA